MKPKILIIFLLIDIFAMNQTLSQTTIPRPLRKAHISPEELISMSSTMPFNQALEILNILSKKFMNKVLVVSEDINSSIGIDIEKKHWLDALEYILRKHKLWYEEHADYLRIFPLVDTTTPQIEKDEEEVVDENELSFKTREVKISAIFFEADGSKLQQLGFSWDIFRGKDVNVNAKLTSAESKSGVFELDINPNLDFGSVLTVFKALESDQIGEVVASPQITVRSGDEGKIQVGSDVAVTIKDFAGNSITQFFSTGSIINVKPMVLQYDSTDFIHLELDIERSNTSSSESGLEIKKSFARTSVLLLDGEETIIGGLYVNEETKTREGVPILKNLPWWFLGLRYFFGFEAKNLVKKELIILLSAELLPTLTERLQVKLRSPAYEQPFNEKREQFWKQLKHYKNESLNPNE